MRLAVRGAAAGGEDDLLHAVVDHGLEQPQRGHDVQLRIGRGIGHRHAHVDLRGVMVEEIEAAPAQLLGRGRIAQIRHDQLGFRIDVLDAAAAQIIDDRHFMTARDIGIDDMRADEPGPSGNEHFHFESRSPCNRARPRRRDDFRPCAPRRR